MEYSHHTVATSYHSIDYGHISSPISASSIDYGHISSQISGQLNHISYSGVATTHKPWDTEQNQIMIGNGHHHTQRVLIKLHSLKSFLF